MPFGYVKYNIALPPYVGTKHEPYGASYALVGHASKPTGLRRRQLLPRGRSGNVVLWQAVGDLGKGLGEPEPGVEMRPRPRPKPGAFDLEDIEGRAATYQLPEHAAPLPGYLVMISVDFPGPRVETRLGVRFIGLESLRSIRSHFGLAIESGISSPSRESQQQPDAGGGRGDADQQSRDLHGISWGFDRSRQTSAATGSLR